MTPESTTTRPLQDTFAAHLEGCGLPPLERRAVTTLQVNVGRLCNLACQHCHVEAGPGRKEIMDTRTADRVLELVERNPHVSLVDLTGGAPEMNPSFRRLVSRTRELGRGVCVRSNLTILLVDGYTDLIPFLAEQQVQIVASLPCYTAKNVDQQRGNGVFEESIEALRLLNAAGFGRGDGKLVLDLVYNPLGASLPGPQAALEAAYKKELQQLFGITFDSLYTITNMPIKRFSDMLRKQDGEQAYQQLLVGAFNAEAAGRVMCRDLLSVGHDGRIHDCDFNQMLDLPLGVAGETPPRTIWDVDDLADLASLRIRTGSHCFGCTAGSGSSCGGVLT